MAENTDVVERKIEVVNRKFEERAGEGGIVSLKIDCSEMFAEEVLNRIMPLIKRDRQGANLELGNANSFLPKIDTDIVNQISNDKQSHSNGTGWGKRSAVAICLISFIILSVFAFQTFLENRQTLALRLASYEKRRLESKAYETVLAHNSENLLRNLRELTGASYRFQITFPGVTSMAAIARHKRGPERIEQAKAAKEFLFTVKKKFDRWVGTPEGFVKKQKATKKDIADFLSVWKETEALLNRLKEAKENPLSLTATIAAIQG